jgi:hypothetical protein
MTLLDVTGKGSHLVNLDLVRCIRTKDSRGKVEVKFVYASGDEDIFAVSSERYGLFVESLLDLGLVAA